MSKLEQVLIIEPHGELRFRGPFTEVVTADLKLTNPSDKRACFKVKTTAPKRYCVRPNSGIIDPKATVGVSVMLQPFEYDPNEKNKHKFMVQTMFAPEGKIENQETLWKECTPDKLMDSKLKCVFDMPAVGENTGVCEVQEEKVKMQQEQQVYTKADSPPPRPNPPSNVGAETDSRKLSEEVKRLQSQVAQLRQENTTIKQEEVRLRKVAMADTVSSTPKLPQVMTETGPLANNIPSYLYLIIVLILGIVIGKIVI